MLNHYSMFTSYVEWKNLSSHLYEREVIASQSESYIMTCNKFKLIKLRKVSLAQQKFRMKFMNFLSFIIFLFSQLSMPVALPASIFLFLCLLNINFSTFWHERLLHEIPLMTFLFLNMMEMDRWHFTGFRLTDSVFF